MKHINIYILAISLFTAASCSKYVDTPLPKNELVSALVFTEDKTATAAVTGIYGTMNSFNYQFANSLMNFLPAMSADEMFYFANFASYDVFRDNTLVPSSQYVNSLWASAYEYIYDANSCIEGLTASSTLTPSVKDQLLGESYFLRAFMHFYLVNMYGDVPLITSTDYKANTLKPREQKAKVYDAIISDLLKAKDLMSADYQGGQRVRPNKAAATALLARTYLYTGQWTLAEAEASEVIANGNYKLLTNLNNVFLANSQEAIWQLQPVNLSLGKNTWEGYTLVPSTPTATAVFRLRNELVNAFETGDLRKDNWTGFREPAAGKYYFPYKYKVRTNTAGVTEYSMVLRLAEQFLIRAEARIQQGTQTKLDDGRKDLDSIRVRAGLNPLSTSLNKAALLLAVEQERRVELFTEWGHRWFDLARTGRSTAVLAPLKTGWQATDILFPIPTNARNTNVNLTQNDGYN